MNSIATAEWARFQEKLNYELQQIESQIQSVEKRKADLKHSIYIYLGFILFLYWLVVFFTKLEDWAMSQNEILRIAFAVFYGLKNGIYMIAVFCFPILFFYLTRACLRWKKHNPQTVKWNIPLREYERGSTPLSREPNYEIERMKLLWIKKKYQFYQKQIEEINWKMEQEPEQFDEDKIKEIIKKMPFYEKVRPAK